VTLVGTSVPRLEDLDLLRGTARFVDDISFDGMLHAAFVRSAHGHAVIRAIDAAAALAVPGVTAVFTARDFAPHMKVDRLIVGLPSPSYRQDLNRPVLVAEETVHVGEPIAIVLASNRYVAEDAAALVDVDYDPLPAVSDARAALQPGAPTVHRASPHNVLAEFDMGYGDVAEVFARAPHVFWESLWQHRGGAHSIECRGGVARYEAGEDLLTLWSSTQTPHTARQLLCEILGRDDDKVRVVTPDIGGGFGPKLIFYPEDAAICLAALLARRPVKWIEDRREHFVASTQERDQYWELEIAVDSDARILGIRGSMIHEHGAYTARGANLPYESAQTVTLPYKVPAYALNVKLALTNKVPVTPVRGAGQTQGVFAMERLLDRVARELGIDRAEVRRRNLIPAAEMPYKKPLKSRGGLQVVLDSGDYPKCHAMALDAVGWHDFPVRQKQMRASGHYIGLGLANFVKGTGRGPFESVSVRIGLSGKVHVASGGAAIGQSTRTMLAQVVADQLGGDLDNIVVTTGDTGAIAIGMGSFNSRLAPLAGSSAHLAAGRLREKVLTIAAQMLQLQVQDIEIEGGFVRRKGSRSVGLALGQIARAVAGTAGFTLPSGVSPGLEEMECFVRDEMTYANGTAAAEVEVDVETGEVAIRKIVFAHDCGRVIHPQVVDGQIVGGVAHGIGNAFYEWMGFDENCQPLTATLADYLMITAAEMPRVQLMHMESPTPLNPIGAKGVGECGVLPTSPALMAAVEDALSPFGVHITRTPVAPGELLALIEKGRKDRSLDYSL
jgi:carbon-monoxide dehydrogenase large subunit